MPKIKLAGMEIEIDEDGFIQEIEKWNQAVAEDLAKMENAYPLGEDHWKVINYLRDFYLKSKIAPPVRMLCKRTGFDLKYICQIVSKWSGEWSSLKPMDCERGG